MDSMISQSRVDLSREARRVIRVSKEIERLANLKAIPLKAFTDSSIQSFLALPAEKFESSMAGLDNYLSVISSVPKAEEGSEITLGEEIEYLHLVYDKFGIEPLTTTYDFIKKGDLIEVYLDSGIQIYRNFEFFNQCSYDLLTLSTHEWFVLYERSKKITDQIFEKVRETMTGDSAVTDVSSVPQHTLRERFLDARKLFEVKFKYLSPLFDRASGRPKGFIITCRSHLIAEGGEASKVVHL